MGLRHLLLGLLSSLPLGAQSASDAGQLSGAGMASKVAGEAGLSRVKGVTISCYSWDWEWGQPAFGSELDRLQALGVNWVAIHPYASIQGDGEVRWKPEALEPGAPAVYLSLPIEAAHARGMGILIKPHLAYWGSRFHWRGEIEFEEPAQRERFWQTYRQWILDLARATGAADSICVGTELDGLLASEAEWRALIAELRGVTRAHLTYASNWDRFEEVGFWDALDVIGVQAYFPLTESEDPSEALLLEGWQAWLARLKRLHLATGKPVVFTELGYDDSLLAARRPWEDDPRGRRSSTNPQVLALQERCLKVAFGVLESESAWLRGAFLWKWFVSGGQTAERYARHALSESGGSFRMDRPALHALMRKAWGSPRDSAAGEPARTR